MKMITTCKTKHLTLKFMSFIFFLSPPMEFKTLYVLYLKISCFPKRKTNDFRKLNTKNQLC